MSVIIRFQCTSLLLFIINNTTIGWGEVLGMGHENLESV